MTVLLTRLEYRVYAALLLDGEVNRKANFLPRANSTRAYQNRLKTGLQTNEVTFEAEYNEGMNSMRIHRMIVLSICVYLRLSAVQTPQPDYTSQIVTPCLSEAMTSVRAGMNSWATWPLKPVATMACMMAG